MNRTIDRRTFIGALSTAALTASACRSHEARGPIVLRLSHSMTAGATALHVFADTFRTLAEKATNNAVTIRIFPSGTLGQEREVVQQVQEGLVDFMVPARPSGGASRRSSRFSIFRSCGATGITSMAWLTAQSASKRLIIWNGPFACGRSRGAIRLASVRSSRDRVMSPNRANSQA